MSVAYLLLVHGEMQQVACNTYLMCAGEREYIFICWQEYICVPARI